MTRTRCDVSVVICTYTELRWDDLMSAVQSVRDQTTQAREILVVVDHNRPLLERLRRDLRDVVVLENSGPQGLSGGRNSGVAAAAGALIAFLDDDAIAAPDWLEWLARWCQDVRVLGAGAAVEPLWQTPAPRWFPDEFGWVLGCSYRGLPRTTAWVRNPFGGCMCVRREVFQEVGGFRSGLGRRGTRPAGCEETELCIRARQRWPGRMFVYEPRSKIWHRVPEERTTWRYFRSRCYMEGYSKALVARLVGGRDALASERAHAIRTLPPGLARNLAESLLRRDPAGLARAGAILAGLAYTTAGYLVGCAVERLPPTGRRAADVVPLAGGAACGS